MKKLHIIKITLCAIYRGLEIDSEVTYGWDNLKQLNEDIIDLYIDDELVPIILDYKIHENVEDIIFEDIAISNVTKNYFFGTVSEALEHFSTPESISCDEIECSARK